MTAIAAPLRTPIWLLRGTLAWVLGLGIAYFALTALNRGFDAHAYWLTGRAGDVLYGPAPGQRDAYLYSPAFAQVIWPLAQLGWHSFDAAWMAAEGAAFGWLLWPVRRCWWAPLAAGLCMVEISVGNVYAFFAVVAVLGLRHPAAWAFPLLTKITPGLGPVWFAARGQWRAVSAALGVTAAVAAVSLTLNSSAWVQWLHFLRAHGGTAWLLPVQAASALAITVYAARTDRPWLLPVAMIVACPVVKSAHALTVLAALPRLAQPRQPRPTPHAAGLGREQVEQGVRGVAG